MLAFGFANVAEGRSLADAQGGGDLGHGQPLVPQLPRSVGLALRAPFLTAKIDAPLLGDLDTRRLTLTTIFKFDFGQPQQHSGPCSTQGTGMVNLALPGTKTDVFNTSCPGGV